MNAKDKLITEKYLDFLKTAYTLISKTGRCKMDTLLRAKGVNNQVSGYLKSKKIIQKTSTGYKWIVGPPDEKMAWRMVKDIRKIYREQRKNQKKIEPKEYLKNALAEIPNTQPKQNGHKITGGQKRGINILWGMIQINF